ncbi:MAG: glucose/arabinose dehydrogenase [Limisphaerales bacterium]|jgi:glucose/arabinose dehydrogenase
MAALALLLASSPTEAAKPKPVAKPRFDSPDIPFRMAPMPATSRSIAVSLATNLHLAFDTERCRTHTVWAGRGLHLLGPQYSGTKRPFISTNDVPVLWTMPPFSAWTANDPAKTGDRLSPKYRAVSSKGGVTTFLYDLPLADGESVAIHESPHAVRVDDMNFVVRRIEVSPSKQVLWFAAQSEFGRISEIPGPADGFLISRPKQPALVTFIKGQRSMSVYTVNEEREFDEEVFTEVGAEKGNPTIKRAGRLGTGWVKIPPHTSALVFETVTYARSPDAGKMRIDPKLLLAAIEGPNMRFPVTSIKDGVTEKPQAQIGAAMPSMSMASTPYYRAEAFPIPREIELLVTGMDFLPNGDLVVCTWIGDVYIIHKATKNVRQARYLKFATGLCEPMGVAVRDGEIYVGLKNELAHLVDTDNNGTADLVERVHAGWSYSGHYNAFSYGPVLDKNNDFVLANAGHSAHWGSKYAGWGFRIAADGSKLTPISSGFREPNGIGVFGPDRDVFITDNQGAWIGACRLDHVAPGKFHGHPSGWPSKKAEYGKHTTMDPPAVWFPYKLARSTTGMAEITGDEFGPFKGQLMVGDFQNAIVTRVMLEKVKGEYQGAVWPFLQRFQSGVNRLVFGPDGRLYVGGCQRTWASVARQEAALERISFTGKMPFEIKEVHAKHDGFELSFTRPVDAETAGDAAAYDVLQYRLNYHATYGSPEYDHDGKKDSATAIEVTGATVSPDGLTVRLHVKGWKTGYVTMVRGLDVRSKRGEKLWHNTFWYTLNAIPDR